MNDDNKPKLGMRAPLGIKRTVETGKVKQSFSHGRSKSVVVEVKRRRVIGKPGEGGAAETDSQVVEVEAPQPVANTPAPVEADTAPAATAAPAPAPAAPKRSEEHTSELQSLMRISYAVFCLKQKTTRRKTHNNQQNT